MMLNKRDRNRLYEAIARGGANTSEFELDDSETGNKLTIKHSSGSTFQIVRSNFLYIVNANVTEGDNWTANLAMVTGNLEAQVRRWASEINKTVGVPDYWDEMKNRRQLLAAVQAGSENTPFTLDEQRQIAAKLQEVRNQIREQFELTSEQIAKLDERLDEAAEASERMGRKDWLLLFAGTILSLILTDILTPAVAEHVFTAVLTALAHLFTGSGGKPPELPPHVLA